jgi:hypothetical protein
MTILEELIDIALKSCEKSRAAECQKQHHARGAALLSSTGKVVTVTSEYFSKDSLLKHDFKCPSRFTQGVMCILLRRPKISHRV